MDDVAAKSAAELVTAGLARADGYAATVDHFGANSPQVTANVEFGTPFSAGYVADDDDIAQIRAWRDLGPAGQGNAVLLDSTTIATARSLLTSTGTDSLHALALWDLTRFVEAVVVYDTVHHFANPSVDDAAINTRLGAPVLRSIGWPRAGTSLRGAPGLVFHTWETTHTVMQGLTAAAGTDTWIGRQIEDLREGWSRVLGHPVTVAEMLDPVEANYAFTSPSQRLIDQLADLIGAVSPAALDSAVFMAERSAPSRQHLSRVLTECNYRGQVNQRLANVLGLPYAPSVARVPFRRLHQDLAREVDDRVRSIELADQVYAERVTVAHRASRIRIALPVLLALVLRRSANRGELWSSLAQLRADAAPYRAQRGRLETALSDGDLDVVADVARAVEDEAARLGRRVAAAGKPTEDLAVTLAEAYPEFATNPLGQIGPTLSALFAAGRALLPAELSRRVLWRWTRPHYRFLSDIRAESRFIVDAMPRIQRFWTVSDRQADVLADRFHKFADLTRPGTAPGDSDEV